MMARLNRTTPTPSPSPQVGGEHTEYAALTCFKHKRTCFRTKHMLSIVEVSAGYSSLRALFGVSLEVAAGATGGVIGPNGAGKTTLMPGQPGLRPPLPRAAT